MNNDDMAKRQKIISAMTTTDGRVLIEQPDGSYRLVAGQTNWQRAATMTDAEIEHQAAQDRAEQGYAADWMDHALPVRQNKARILRPNQPKD